MSDFSFNVSYLDTNGQKQEKMIHLDSQEYKKHCAQNYQVLLQNYSPEQAETHILATKKHYIAEAIAHQFNSNTSLEYDMAEIINTLDRESRDF